ncbi:hypothetical protein ABES04_24070 [Brevibacillus parabrevis]
MSNENTLDHAGYLWRLYGKWLVMHGWPDLSLLLVLVGHFRLG